MRRLLEHVERADAVNAAAHERREGPAMCNERRSTGLTELRTQCQLVGEAPDTRRDAALRCAANRRSRAARCAAPSGAGASSPSSAHRVPTAAGTLAQCRTLKRGALQLGASSPSPAKPDVHCHGLRDWRWAKQKRETFHGG